MVSKINIPLDEEGFLIRSVDYRDKDRILSFFTREHGRMDFIALGAKNSQKRFAGAIDFLNFLKLNYQSSSRGGLHRLNQVEIIESYPGIRADYDRTVLALEWMRLLSRALPVENPIPGFLELLQNHLKALESLPAPWVDLVFRRQALSALGYHLELDHCLHCKKGGGGAAYFSLSRGGLLCEDCHRGATEGKIMGFFPDSWWVLGSREDPWEGRALGWAQRLLETAYQEYLNVPPAAKSYLVKP